MFDADIRTDIGRERHQQFIEVAQENNRYFRQSKSHDLIIWMPLIKVTGQMLGQMRNPRFLFPLLILKLTQQISLYTHQLVAGCKSKWSGLQSYITSQRRRFDP
jgi:hypothetical protein